jgi:hypothetical protein
VINDDSDCPWSLPNQVCYREAWAQSCATKLGPAVGGKDCIDRSHEEYGCIYLVRALILWSSVVEGMRASANARMFLFASLMSAIFSRCCPSCLKGWSCSFLFLFLLACLCHNCLVPCCAITCLSCHCACDALVLVLLVFS